MDSERSQIDPPVHGKPHVLVAGEALIDMVSFDGHPNVYRAIPGGSPFNVAIGLSRLNIPTGFLGKLSTDPFGELLKATLEDNHVDLAYVKGDLGPTQLAMVTRKPGYEPQYIFYGHETADANLQADDLPTEIPDFVHALHFGSLSLISQPTGTTLTQLMSRENQHRIVSLDPNVRPSRIPDIAAYRLQLEEWVRLSHIVKLSQADLDVLCPTVEADAVAARWLMMGPKLVVVTQGKNGATGYTAEESVYVPAPAIKLVDSIGAGDAFMSGLLAWLHDHGKLSISCLPQLNPDNLRRMLQFSAQVAAATCKQVGADPPHRGEIAP
jgi:fructokinase